MKFILAGVFFLSMLTQQKCRSGSEPAACYKGRLEIKGICSNYTITLLDGALDTARIAASWTDENTGKAYKNVFALESPCGFPESIREGQEFYFTLVSPEPNCAVCQAFYPVPPKALAIRVLDKPCR